MANRFFNIVRNVNHCVSNVLTIVWDAIRQIPTAIIDYYLFLNTKVEQASLIYLGTFGFYFFINGNFFRLLRAILAREPQSYIHTITDLSLFVLIVLCLAILVKHSYQLSNRPVQRFENRPWDTNHPVINSIVLENMDLGKEKEGKYYIDNTYEILSRHAVLPKSESEMDAIVTKVIETTEALAKIEKHTVNFPSQTKSRSLISMDEYLKEKQRKSILSKEELDINK